MVLRLGFEERAREPGAATTMVPIPTKEMLEMMRLGTFAPQTHEVDDLEKGLHPLVLGRFQGSELGEVVLQRN